MTSHAAVVARGMGKPCVAGCEGLSIDAKAGVVHIGEHEVGGDTITIDGGTGRVIIGPVRLVPPAIDENFGTILEWADEVAAPAACVPTATRLTMPPRRASSAPRASASAAPSTCSWRRIGCRSCRR